jgi:hypothetical protein
VKLELRAAVDSNRIAGDPAGVVGCEESDDPSDIIRLGDALQGLHPQRDIATRIRLREVGHVCFDDTGNVPDYEEMGYLTTGCLTMKMG